MKLVLVPIIFLLELLETKKSTAKLRFGLKNKLLAYQSSSNTFCNHRIYRGEYDMTYVTSIYEFSSTIKQLAIDNFVRFVRVSSQGTIIEDDYPHVMLKKCRGLTQFAQEKGINALEWEITKREGEKLKEQPFNSEDMMRLFQYLVKITTRPIHKSPCEKSPKIKEENSQVNTQSYINEPEEIKEPATHTTQPLCIPENLGSLDNSPEPFIYSNFDSDSELDNTNPKLPDSSRSMFYEDYEHSMK